MYIMLNDVSSVEDKSSLLTLSMIRATVIYEKPHVRCVWDFYT